MIQLIRLAVLGAVVLGATVLMALPRPGRADDRDGTAVSEDTGARGVSDPAPGSPDPPPAENHELKDTEPIVAPVQRQAKPAASSAKSHEIRSGDTLQKISMHYYGTFRKWRRIADANPGVDPGRLRPGTKLVIPQ